MFAFTKRAIPKRVMEISGPTFEALGPVNSNAQAFTCPSIHYFAEAVMDWLGGRATPVRRNVIRTRSSRSIRLVLRSSGLFGQPRDPLLPSKPLPNVK